jgi:hypothetical protein
MRLYGKHRYSVEQLHPRIRSYWKLATDICFKADENNSLLVSLLEKVGIWRIWDIERHLDRLVAKTNSVKVDGIRSSR